jgi:hypothetical protein
LPGIGYKAATCVVAYSFGRDVCPVDTHTYRVAVRLGLVPPDTPELGRKAHLAVELALPPGERLGFHINVIAHGRQHCHLERPLCEGVLSLSTASPPSGGDTPAAQPPQAHPMTRVRGRVLIRCLGYEPEVRQRSAFIAPRVPPLNIYTECKELAASVRRVELRRRQLADHAGQPLRRHRPAVDEYVLSAP